MHCVDHYLAVKYDGKGNVFVGGAEPSENVHHYRTDCSGKPQGWVKVLSFNIVDYDYITLSVYGQGAGLTTKCGG